MISASQVMYDLIKKSNSFSTVTVNEVEEVVDTGLPKTEDNIQKVALEYLDEKGFARRVDNLDRAKQHVIDSSQFSDTVCVRMKREMNEDLLSDCEDEDLLKLVEASLLDKLTRVDEKLIKLSCPRYEYAVEIVSDILTDADKSQGSLSEFESFEMLLNRYASAGWKVKSIIPRETTNHKISMAGFSTQTKQIVIVFERLR